MANIFIYYKSTRPLYPLYNYLFYVWKNIEHLYYVQSSCILREIIFHLKEHY